MKIQSWLFIGLLGLYGMTSCSNGIVKNSRPNIILIYADDLGYGEIGAYGQTKIETPNIDRLAKQGMLFTQFYTGSPVCAPSRCILLTGKHSGHAAVRGNDEAGYRGDVWDYKAMALDPGLEGQAPMPAAEETFAELLQSGGYATALIGKWGLGFPGSESTPTTQGFDYFLGYNCQRQAHTYHPLHLWENDTRIYLDNDTIAPGTKLLADADTLDPASYARFTAGEYAPERLFNGLTDWVSSKKNNAFFLYWATPLPHLALQAPKRWVDYYVEKFGDEAPYTANDNKYGYFPCRYPHATYAAMVSYLDENIGKLMLQLEELGIADNTLIFFTSDNGPSYTAGVDSPWFDSGGPFKSEYGWGKGFLREAGIRVPFIAKWSNHISANTKSVVVASMQDLYPTILDLAVVNYDHSSIDGLSLAPTLLEMGEQKIHDYLYWEFPETGGQRALRWGNWKAYNKDLKSTGDTTIYLYNLATDMQEQHDIANEYPEKIDFVKSIFKKEHISSDNPRWKYPVIDEQ